MAGGISALGIGSGLDIQGLIDNLLTAEGKPRSDAFDKKEIKIQSKISVMGTIKAALFDLNGAMTSLKLQSTFFSYDAAISDSSLFSASVVNGNSAGNHTVEVTALAQAHKLSSSSYADTTSSLVGTGTLTFDFGSVSGGGTVFTPDAAKSGKTITITDGSLAGIRDAINQAKIGVTASIVYNGTGYQMVLTSQSGATNAMRISVADSDGINTDAAGLSGFAFDPVGATKNLTEMTAAKDAVARIDGITVTGSTNTLTSVLSGVTLTLKREAPGTIANMEISSNATTAESAITTFVNNYNSLIKTLKDASYYDKESKKSGTLIGDPLIWGIQQGLRNMMNKSSGDGATRYKTLSSVGVSFEKDGTLTFSKSTFEAAYADRPDEVQRMFGGGAIPNANSGIAGVEWLTTPVGITSGSIPMEVTQAATHGKLTSAVLGAGVTFPYTTSATASTDETFSLTVDGISSGTLSMPDGITYNSGADLALAIQNIINNDAAIKISKKTVTVSYDGGTNQLTIQSNSLGSGSRVSILSASANMTSNYGIGVGAGVDGTDIQGTIGGLPATGSGTVLTGTDIYATASVRYQGSSTGVYLPPTTTVKGFAYEAQAYLDGFLKFEGVMNARISIYNEDIEKINEERDKLSRHLAQLRDTLIRQYTAMDSLVGKLNATGNYLSSQLSQGNSKK